MTVRRSAGILLFRRRPDGLQVLLAHTGGPFWAAKDVGAWSVPKGEYTDEEAPVDAARREFTEELGLPVPDGQLRELGEVVQKNGKRVTAWALDADLDPGTIVPGTFALEWPPRSGRMIEVPEIDRVQWFPLEQARPRLITGQAAFLDRLAADLGDQEPSGVT